MKTKFIITKNVKRFAAAAENINHKALGVERMALVHGEPGLGKTETALWFAARNECVYIRTMELMTGPWLLRKITKELRLPPSWRTEDIFNQLVKNLSERPRVIMFDEADGLSRELLETLRALHDIAHVPMIFIGEEGIEGKFGRYPRLLDRFVEIVQFDKLNKDDVAHIAVELSDIKFEPDAIERISTESDGKLRRVITMIHRAERIAKVNQIRSIAAKEF